MGRGRTIIVALLIGVLLLAGCGSAADEDQAVGGEVPAGQEGESAEGPTEDQAIITTARAAMEVSDAADAVDEVVSQVESYDGVVEGRRESAGDDGGAGDAALTLRVPAESLGDLLDGLDEVGEVVERTETSRDVTGAAEDLDARIGASETSVERLLEIMEEAETSEDLLEAETTLSERQSELEALQAERSALDDRIEMSTLELEISGEPLGGVEAGGFLGGLESGWRGLTAGANWLLVVAGAMLPTLLVLAPPVALCVLLVRRSLRRRRARRVRSGAAD